MPLTFITGGGKRLGRGLAVEFAKKLWDVAIVYNSSQKEALQTFEELKTFGTKISLLKADVTNKKEIEDAFKKVTMEIGVPDVLINNAGVFPPLLKLDEITEDIWAQTLNINTNGAFITSQAFARIALKGARIVNIASLGGLEVWKHRIPYNVSKAALIQLTKALARELAPNISVNCVNPGTVLMPDELESHDTTLFELEKIPMQRYATVSDIFDAVWFFSTCSHYITGQMITVDGGYHLAS